MNTSETQQFVNRCHSELFSKKIIRHLKTKTKWQRQQRQNVDYFFILTWSWLSHQQPGGHVVLTLFNASHTQCWLNSVPIALFHFVMKLREKNSWWRSVTGDEVNGLLGWIMFVMGITCKHCRRTKVCVASVFLGSLSLEFVNKLKITLLVIWCIPRKNSFRLKTVSWYNF